MNSIRTIILSFGRSVRVICLVLMVGQVVVAQQKSVRPGINKSFQDPDVPKFVQRFEREGREVYDLREEIIAASGVKQGMVIADVGAGTGLFTRLFAKKVGKGGRVFAVDIAATFVKHVELTCRQEGVKNVVGVVCQQDSVNLPKESIDVAFICDVYHHFEYPQKTMRSIHAALRPGGRVVLVDFKRIEGVSSKWILGHLRAGQEVFTKEILGAGFRQVEQKKFDKMKNSYFLIFEKAKPEK